MNLFAPYFVIAAALFIGVFIAVFSSATVVPNSPAVVTTEASSTIAVVSTPELPELTIPNLKPSTSPATTSPAQTQPAKKIKPPPPAPAPTVSIAPPVLSAPTPPVPTSAELDASAALLRAALVNIVCYVPAGSSLRSILGSGVFIDAKGIIITNAHIAQYYLLADRNAKCRIRSGSPAIDKYEASLIYISPPWLRANANTLTQSNPIGTGEYDFAFLAITKSLTAELLPSSFPYIPLATNPPANKTPVVIASYGAQFLESSQIQSSLFPTIVFGSVKDIFTFASTTIDIIALGGSAAAQEGSSGGGVSDGNAKLIGVITTSTVKGETSSRQLNAITSSYIRAEYASETGSALDILLNQAVSQSVFNFASQIPSLESILTAQLQ